MKQLYDIAPYTQWCGSELAIVLDGGTPFIYAYLLVWPEQDGPAYGAKMGVTRNSNNTVDCFFDGAAPIAFGTIGDDACTAKIGDQPKYLVVGRIFFGQHELPIPIRPELRP